MWSRACREAFTGIEALLKSKYPHASVHVFGSAANGLGIRDNNDIDVSLSLPLPDDTRETKGGVAAGAGAGSHHTTRLRTPGCAAEPSLPLCAASQPVPPTTPPAPAGDIVQDLEQLFLDVPQLVGDVFAIPRARIPVIKAVWVPTGTKVSGSPACPTTLAFTPAWGAAAPHALAVFMHAGPAGLTSLSTS